MGALGSHAVVDPTPDMVIPCYTVAMTINAEAPCHTPITFSNGHFQKKDFMPKIGVGADMQTPGSMLLVSGKVKNSMAAVISRVRA